MKCNYLYAGMASALLLAGVANTGQSIAHIRARDELAQAPSYRLADNTFKTVRNMQAQHWEFDLNSEMATAAYKQHAQEIAQAKQLMPPLAYKDITTVIEKHNNESKTRLMIALFDFTLTAGFAFAAYKRRDETL